MRNCVPFTHYRRKLKRHFSQEVELFNDARGAPENVLAQFRFRTERQVASRMQTSRDGVIHARDAATAAAAGRGGGGGGAGGGDGMAVSEGDASKRLCFVRRSSWLYVMVVMVMAACVVRRRVLRSAEAAEDRRALDRDLVLVVRRHVVLQVQLRGETLPTARIRALKRLEVGLPVPAQVGVFMGQQVLGKVPPLTELLSADFARKRLLSSVNSHVACEQSLVREALVAVGVGALNKTRC